MQGVYRGKSLVPRAAGGADIPDVVLHKRRPGQAGRHLQPQRKAPCGHRHHFTLTKHVHPGPAEAHWYPHRGRYGVEPLLYLTLYPPALRQVVDVVRPDTAQGTVVLCAVHYVGAAAPVVGPDRAEEGNQSVGVAQFRAVGLVEALCDVAVAAAYEPVVRHDVAAVNAGRSPEVVEDGAGGIELETRSNLRAHADIRVQKQLPEPAVTVLHLVPDEQVGIGQSQAAAYVESPVPVGQPGEEYGVYLVIVHVVAHGVCRSNALSWSQAACHALYVGLHPCGHKHAQPALEALIERQCVAGIELAVVHELHRLPGLLPVAEYLRVQHRGDAQGGRKGGGVDARGEVQAHVPFQDLHETQVVLETELGTDGHGLLHRGAVAEDAAAVAVPLGPEGYLLVQVYLLVVEIVAQFDLSPVGQFGRGGCLVYLQWRLAAGQVVCGQGRGVVSLPVVQVDSIDVQSIVGIRTVAELDDVVDGDGMGEVVHVPLAVGVGQGRKMHGEGRVLLLETVVK